MDFIQPPLKSFLMIDFIFSVTMFASMAIGALTARPVSPPSSISGRCKTYAMSMIVPTIVIVPLTCYIIYNNVFLCASRCGATNSEIILVGGCAFAIVTAISGAAGASMRLEPRVR